MRMSSCVPTASARCPATTPCTLMWSVWRTRNTGVVLTGGIRYWRDLLLFYEYLHGDNGSGIGASHKTGWTGSVARALHLFATTTAQRVIALGQKTALFETESAWSGVLKTRSGVDASFASRFRPPSHPKPQYPIRAILTSLHVATRTTKALTVFSGGLQFVLLIRKRARDRELEPLLPMAKRRLTFFRQD